MNMRLKLRIIEQYGTQRKFAQTLGVPESVVSNAVRGAASPRHKERWAEALNCTVDDIFGNNKPPDKSWWRKLME